MRTSWKKNPDLALGDYVGKQGIEFMLEERHARGQGACPVRSGRQRPPPQGTHPQAPARRARNLPVHRPRTPEAGHGLARRGGRGRGRHRREHRPVVGPGNGAVLQLQRLFLRPDAGAVGQAQRQPAPPHAEPRHPVRVPARLGVQARGGRGGAALRDARPQRDRALLRGHPARAAGLPLLAQGRPRQGQPGTRPGGVLRRLFL